jgi:iron complex outermembrane receptor protein
MRTICVLLLAGLSWAAQAQCTLTGTVTDAAGTTLAGANVRVLGTERGAATATDGTYRLPDLAAGTYRLEFSYVGYQTRTLAYRVAPGTSNCRLDVTLREGALPIRELIVTGTRVQERTPVSYVTLEREEIQENNLGQDVPFQLRWTPSAVVTSDAGTGIGYTGIWIRGTDPTRTNVTLNGIPLNDAESQGVFWVNLPDFASSTDEIQVQRGVGTSTNGAGAFGATINIETTTYRPEAYASVDVGAGSFNTQRGTLRFGTGLLGNRFTVDGRLSRITSDGYIDRGSADLDAWYLSGAYVGNGTVLRLNAFSGHEITYQAWYGVPRDSLATNRTYNPAGTERPGDPYENEVDNYTQTHYQLLLDQKLSDFWQFNLSGHYTVGQGFFEQYKADEDFADYGFTPITMGAETIDATDLIRRRWLDNDFYGAVYALRYRKDGGPLTATLGGGYHIYEGDHFGEVIWARFAADSEIRDLYYDNDARKTDFNVYSKFNYAFTPALNGYVDLQVRRVGYEFLGIDENLAELQQREELTFFNPKAGLFFTPAPGWEAYASVGVAQREPNRNDYVDNPAGQRPRPEKLYNAELGVGQTAARFRWQANGYYMYYQDQLVLSGRLNDVGAYIRENVDESFRLGLELQAGVQLTDGLSLGFGGTLSRNRVLDYTEFIDRYDPDFNYLGQERIERPAADLAFSPNAQANFEIRYALLRKQAQQDLDITLRTKYVGERHLDNSGDPGNVLDPYAFSDLRLNYTWRPAFVRAIRFTASLRNIFDTLYENNGWSYRYEYDGTTVVDQGFYPQAGRNVLLGLGVDF